MGASQTSSSNHYNVSIILSNPARRSLQDRLRQLQILLPGISQQSLARRLAIPRRTLRRWLSGETQHTTPARERKLSQVVSYERRKITRIFPFLKPLPIIPRLTGITAGIPTFDVRGLTELEVLLFAAAAGDANLRSQFQLEVEQPYFDRKGRGTSNLKTKPLEITSAALQTDEDVDFWLDLIFANANRDTDRIEGAAIKP